MHSTCIYVHAVQLYNAHIYIYVYLHNMYNIHSKKILVLHTYICTFLDHLQWLGDQVHMAWQVTPTKRKMHAENEHRGPQK